MAQGESSVLRPGERLRSARKRLGLTQVELSKASGVSQATISQVEKGESPGSEAAWLKLARALRLPPEEFNVSAIMSGEAQRLPVLGAIAAGPLTEVPEAGRRETLTVTPDQYRENRYILDVRGVSMYPRIQEGDRVLVESTDLHLPPKGQERRLNDIRPLRELHGRIVAVVINGEATLKRLEVQQRERGSFYLILRSDNPEIPVRVVDKRDDVRVVGRVMEIWGRG